MSYTVRPSYVPLGARKSVSGNSYDVEWVLVSTTAMTQHEVLNIPELPLLRSRNPEDYSVVLTEIQADPRQNADPYKWTIILTYTDATGNLIFPSNSNDPTKWPAEIGFDSYTYQSVVRKAYRSNGRDKLNPSIDVENSAGLPFDPPYTQPEAGTVINISRNERFYNGFDKRLYRNSINRKKITIAGYPIGPYEGWMRTLRGQRRVDDEGEFYWNINYEIVVKDWDGGWKVGLQDTSFYYKEVVGTNVKLKAIVEYMVNPDLKSTSKEGQRKVTEAQKLNGSGALATAVLDPETGLYKIPTTYLYFYTYPVMEWELLKLPEQEADHAYAN